MAVKVLIYSRNQHIAEKNWNELGVALCEVKILNETDVTYSREKNPFPSKVPSRSNHFNIVPSKTKNLQAFLPSLILFH